MINMSMTCLRSLLQRNRYNTKNFKRDLSVGLRIDQQEKDELQKVVENDNYDFRNISDLIRGALIHFTDIEELKSENKFMSRQLEILNKEIEKYQYIRVLIKLLVKAIWYQITFRGKKKKR